jgi:hypothetical protein
MIQVQYKDGYFCPLVLCDHCGQQIADYKKANATWDESGVVRHVHKGVCDGWPARGQAYWCPLEEHLFSLLYNTGAKTRRFKAAFDEVCAWR